MTSFTFVRYKRATRLEPGGNAVLHLLRCLTAILTLGLGLSAHASPLPQPDGPVLLRVSGPIAQTNDGDAAAFDLDMLRALETETIRTSTIWTDGLQEFTGVPLRVLADTLGIEASMLRARAINDYAVDIPIEDAQAGHALIAFARNGKPMTVRDKGPLWVIYPYDSDPRFQAEVYYARSIWQLDRIEVVE